jgi:rhodanese-related sulfurtransferase
MRFKYHLLVILNCILVSCNGQKNDAYESSAPIVFAEKIKETSNPQIIDVRSPEEYASQHLDNAKNINWNGNDFESKVATLDKKQPVFVYCMVGGRSKKASDKLIEMGFAKVYDLQGGIMKWNAAGLSKPSDKIIGMCSQEYGDLLKSKSKIMINFYADWCEPCKKMKPYITQMQTDLKDTITIIRLNADENKTLISELKIDELPAILVYENAELKWKHLGFISEEDLKKQLQ